MLSEISTPATSLRQHSCLQNRARSLEYQATFLQLSDVTLIVRDLPMPQSHHTDLKRSDVATLVKLINAHAPYDGRFELRVPGV